MESISKFYSAL